MAIAHQARNLAFMGAGWMGFALATAHARAGHNVILGERDATIAQGRAAELLKRLTAEGRTPPKVEGMDLGQAASAADVVFLVYGNWVMDEGLVSAEELAELAARAATTKALAPSLRHKVVIDCTNIGYMYEEDAWGQTSSLLQHMAAAGDVPGVSWAAAWKHVYAPLVETGGDPKNPMSVLVCGEERARSTAIELVDSLGGWKGLNAGGVAESKLLEVISPNWIMKLKKDNFPEGQWPAWRFGV